MKILSFQPFSLYQNGGGSRILRRLYQGREAQVISLSILSSSSKIEHGPISEIIVNAFFMQRKWMRWRLSRGAAFLRQKVFKFLTIRRIQRAAVGISYDVIHLVSHGPFAIALCGNFFTANKKLWISFHDHFSTTECSFNEANQQWNQADRRLVISEELGYEYQKLFGKYEFEVITDGVSKEEISKPVDIKANNTISVYFAGLLHIDYYPLFEVLADALDVLSYQNFVFKLILRGTQVVEFLNNRSFEMDYRTNFISDEAVIKIELNTASILYLPIKFTLPDFYLYSMSTKMVSYLGAPGSMLYHGPGDSAVCNLLKESNSAICCTSLDVNNLVSSIKLLINNKGEISTNAKLLARSNFDLAEIQNRFWQD